MDSVSVNCGFGGVMLARATYYKWEPGHVELEFRIVDAEDNSFTFRIAGGDMVTSAEAFRKAAETLEAAAESEGVGAGIASKRKQIVKMAKLVKELQS